MAIKFIQPALAKYRHDFFERIYKIINKNNDTAIVYFSTLKKNNSNVFAKKKIYKWAFLIGEVKNILPGIFWQKGINKIDIFKKDIIVLSGNPRFISNFLLFIRARFVGSRIIWWGQLKGCNTSNFSLAIKLFFIRFFDGAIFYTEDERKIFYKFNILRNRKPILGINNGIDNTNIKILRDFYNPEKRKLRVLFIGRITNKSNFDVLVNAFAYKKLKEVELHVIGKKDYQNQYKKWNFENIIFHGEIIEEKEIAKIANKCRLFVYTGSVGLSLIHAMHYGLPCILHDQRNKHMPEVAAFRKDKTGETFLYNNPNDLSRVIWDLINNKNKLKMYSFNSLEIVNNDFNTDKMSEKFLKFIKSF